MNSPLLRSLVLLLLGVSACAPKGGAQPPGPRAPQLAEASLSVAENSAPGTVVGVLTPQGGEPGRTYSVFILSGNRDAAFAIAPGADGGGGFALRVANADALDFERSAAFELALEVRDDAEPTLRHTATVRVGLTDANEAPSVVGGPFSLAPTPAPGTRVGTLGAADPDVGQQHALHLTDDTSGGAFALDPASGALTLRSTPPPGEHRLTVRVSDSGSPPLSRERSLTVSVENAAPEVRAATFSVPAHALAGALVGQVEVADPDAGPGTHTFALTQGNGAGAFALASTTGRLTVANPGALTVGTHALTVRATDGGAPARSGSAVVTVEVALQERPSAVADGPYRLSTGATLDVDLLANDARGTPGAVVQSFGGGSLGGTSTTFAAGTSVPLAGGALQVTSAGRVRLTPGSAGSFSFRYRLASAAGTSDATVTLQVCPDLAAGGVARAQMPRGGELCLTGGAGGAEYTVVPVNRLKTRTHALTVTASGVTAPGEVAVRAEPAPTLRTAAWSSPPAQPLVLAAPAPVESREPEAAIRRRERAELTARMGGARAHRTGARALGPAFAAAAAPPPAVGSQLSFNAQANEPCSAPDVRTGTVEAVSSHAIVVADDANPAGLTRADYEQVAARFDALVWPTVTGAFGEPSDVDGNGRVIVVYTRAVNELTPPGAGWYVGGFFYARDLFPQAECATSNERDMFYMLAADPGGAAGNAFSVDLVKQVTLGTLAHELEHLVNSSRRLFVNDAWAFEETWLDEGLAHISEELVFHAAAGTEARQNLGLTALLDGGAKQAAFGEFMSANLGRLEEWMGWPHANGFFQDNDELATRGHAWAFLRYAADRKGGDELQLWHALANSQVQGLENLEEVLEPDLAEWMVDFAVAFEADDTAPAPLAIHAHPSWHFRELYGSSDPLRVRVPADGVPSALSLAPGGSAAYLRVGVRASETATVTLAPAGTAGLEGLEVAIFRRR
jgi:hypothetical protein